jgi:hypothetical protein
LGAAISGKSCESVLNWQYRQSNVQAAIEHYYQSSIEAEHDYQKISGTKARLDYIDEWLAQAVKLAGEIETKLRPSQNTSTSHVRSWAAAFRNYRTDHDV